ncbi:MAG: peptidase S9, partial [Prevotella sp.]|nr:peptidase S9 [Prevotella sp.]
MIKQTALSLAVALMSLCPTANAQTMIGKSNIQLKNKLLTPEALWAMGRISNAKASPDGKKIVYQVGYYSIQENKGQQVIYIANADGSDKKQLTTSANSETDPCWINNGTQIAFLSKGQIWSMDLNGANRKQLTNSKTGI